MKESAKQYKAHKQRQSFTLSKRLPGDDLIMRQEEEKNWEGNKRMKANDGSMIIP